MVVLIILLSGVLLLSLLLYHEKNGSPKSALAVKAALSLLFVITAAIQPRATEAYGRWMLGGLLFCLIGDVCLALRGERTFKIGLLAFLLGHVFYIGGFQSLLPIRQWILPGSFSVWIVSLLIFFWLWPHLKRMALPVVAYILVITVMATGALAVFWKTELAFPVKMTILSGAVSFYLSDVFVARDKFVRRDFTNRLMGLPLYYLDQFLLAFSIGMIK